MIKNKMNVLIIFLFNTWILKYSLIFVTLSTF